MINDLSDLRSSPLLKEVHLEWTPATVEQFSYVCHPDIHQNQNDYLQREKGCFFAIKAFRNSLELSLRQVEIDDDLHVTQKEVGRFSNPVLIVMMAKAVREIHKHSDGYSYYPVSDEIREYIKHKLHIQP